MGEVALGGSDSRFGLQQTWPARREGMGFQLVRARATKDIPLYRAPEKIHFATN